MHDIVNVPKEQDGKSQDQPLHGADWNPSGGAIII